MYATISFESNGHALMNHRFFSVLNAELLLATTSGISAKNVIASKLTEEQQRLRKTSAELLFSSELPQSSASLFTISVRNVLSNLRCVAYKAGFPIITVDREDLYSPRSFFALGYTHDRRFKMKEIWISDFTTFSEFQWFITGIPVIWEGLNEKQIFESILTESADHSHVFQIPRGKHPLASSETIENFNKLNQIFVSGLSENRAQLAEKIFHMASILKLVRESNYFHNCLGVDNNGNLIQLADKDLLENLGQRMNTEYGVKSAICVDNGGSIESVFYPNGADNPGLYKYEFGHRFPGTAYIGLALETDKFKS